MQVKHAFLLVLLHNRFRFKNFLILFMDTNNDSFCFCNPIPFCRISLVKPIIFHSGKSTNAIFLNLEVALLCFLNVYCTLRRYCCYGAKTCSDLALAQVFYEREQKKKSTKTRQHTRTQNKTAVSRSCSTGFWKIFFGRAVLHQTWYNHSLSFLGS